MKHTDYKFWYIKRDDNGFITEAAIRFYEGNYQIIDGKEKYVRLKRLEKFTELKHLAKKGKIKGLYENDGKTAVLYHEDDFGKIKTDEELMKFLNSELKKDKGRQPVKEQI